MQRSFHFTRFIAASLGLHLLFFAALVYLARFAEPPTAILPVDIVNLPKELLRKLPPLSPPGGSQQQRPDQPPPRASVPAPERFGAAPDIALPRTTPGLGRPDGSREGTTDAGKHAGTVDRSKGPLPFLSQADIDELARKGMPERRPGDNSVTLDTDEFKFISYNRWLKFKVEGVLRYPELAAHSGIQGTLYIQFDIMQDGSLGRFEVIKSSGYKILDIEAERAIRSAAPFQPLPEDWRMDRYSVRAAVLFYLSEAYIR